MMQIYNFNGKQKEQVAELLKEEYEKGRRDGAAEEKQSFLKQSEQYLNSARSAEEKYLSALEKLEDMHKKYVSLLEEKA